LAFTITTNGSSATLVGTDAPDAANLTAGLGIATVDAQGFEGDDTLTLGSAQANSLVLMGKGDDIVSAANLTASLIKGEVGQDILTTGNLLAAAKVAGGKKRDTISVGNLTGSSIVAGGKGADTISALSLASNSEARGGKGADVINITTVNNTASVKGGAGDDRIAVGSIVFGGTVFGGAGDDTITSGAGTGTIYGEDGDDTLSSAAGGTIYAGAGDDTVTAAAVTTQRIFLGDGADEVNLNLNGSGTVRDYSAGVDVIDLNIGVTSLNGNTNINFQSGGNLSLNSTVYEATQSLLATGLSTTAINSFLASNTIFIGGRTGTSASGTLQFIAYSAGNIATLYNVAITTSNGIVTATAAGTATSITLNNVAANSLTAADFV